MKTRPLAMTGVVAFGLCVVLAVMTLTGTAQATFLLIDDFDARFTNGPPSLIDCASLEVEGDVTFGRGVSVKGTVRLSSPDGPSTVPDGATLTGNVTL